MDFQIIWTSIATEDLQSIPGYIAEHNPAAADRIVSALLERVRLLKTVPLIGRHVPRDSTGPIREVIQDKYRIIYRVKEAEEQVEILMIWHCARDEPQLPELN